MFRVLHVRVIYGDAVPFSDMFEAAINAMATDWLRYAAGSWLVWTEKPIPAVNSTLQPWLRSIDSLLILSVNPHEVPGGQMHPSVWEWINRPRDQMTGFVHVPPPPPTPPRTPPPPPPRTVPNLLMTRKPPST